MQPNDVEKKGDQANSHLQQGMPSALKQANQQDYAQSNLVQIPSISIPKGGGAVKSIDEKFQVNAANGTSNLSIPIPFSKSRSAFGPSLTLNYNSGSGNSPFGLGWNISLPSIKRRTDKLLPRYFDADDSDIFQITGSDDLVVKLVQDAKGNWIPDIITTASYNVKRYVPRIESAFTLIEQVSSSDGMYWKTTSKENVVTFFGLDASARVADPNDPSRIFEWLPDISYDDKGNCFQFFYVAEDFVNVPLLPHEANRLNGNMPVANTYLKQVAYGNTAPYSPVPQGGVANPYNPAMPVNNSYMFSLVLDYGDHDIKTPTIQPSTTWGCRLDPFSNGKCGFDMRTYRLCRRLLLFHNFTELDAQPVLVKSIDLAYQYYNFQPVADPYSITLVEADFITGITESGWLGNATAGYTNTSLPQATFSYQLPVWDDSVIDVDAGNMVNIPQGLIPPYQFTDLYNEGIAGILSEQGEGWYYNYNMGGGVFTPASLISPKPSFTGLDGKGLQLQGLTGDGRKFVVSTNAPNRGYFELTDQEQWLPFMAFEKYPNIDFSDPNVKFIDLNGDGMPDVVLSEEQIFTWYPAAGIAGYDSPELAPKPFDEEKGPSIVFADPVESIFLADMTGDGLTDIVRIRNGEINYWPNRGYGLFGAKVNMLDAPVFDTIDLFNPAYVQLADINGTGATDIIYLGQDAFCAWLNLSGNGWGRKFEMPAFPGVSFPNKISVIDFLGNGTSCIVWSSPLAGNADAPLRYIDLMGGNKPYLMNGYNNGMGKQATIQYKSSTWFYLQDKITGKPWITKLCFPVQCVQNMAVTDGVSGTTYSTSYTYHHGYYDHAEKEYRGFGRVEQIDTDIFSVNAAADQAPILTKTWYHTGVYFGEGNILHQLSNEYFKNPAFTEYTLPEPTLPAGLTADEAREAARACKGMTLRQEVYALDNSAQTPYPYTAAEHNNNILILQPQAGNMYSVFQSLESEMITYNYERNPTDPRVAHTLNTAFDAYGNIIDSYAVAYPRVNINAANPGGLTLPGNQPLPAAVMAEQQKLYIVNTHHAYTADIITTDTYRLSVACEKITSQLTGITPASAYFTIEELTNFTTAPVVTKLKHHRVLFLKDDLVTALPLYTMDTLGLLYQQYHLAFNAKTTALTTKATNANFQSAQYVLSDNYITANHFPSSDAKGEWWVPSGINVYLNAGGAQPFYTPYQVLDAYGNATTFGYDNYWLLLNKVTDALNNVTKVNIIDYRVLSPSQVIDMNNNVTSYQFDSLGQLVAVAQTGKGEGDVFDGSFTADLTPSQITAFFNDPYTNGPALLQGATTRYVYNFLAGGPFSAGTIIRKVYANQVVDARVDVTSVPYQYSFEYSDGLGRIAMKKVQGDLTTGTPGGSSCDGTNAPTHQWIGSGKIVYNNKAKPVMQYEPFFSASPTYEEAPANGVTAIIHYDPLGRAVLTNFPDGSFSNTAFDAWVNIVYDQNDNVAGSGWYLRASGSSDKYEQDAAAKALAHNNTPAAEHLDVLGRNFYTAAFNIVGGSPVFYASQTVLDVESNPLSVIDAMGNTVMQWEYDLLNRHIHQISMDADERWILHEVMDKQFMQWDNNGTYAFVYTYTYDLLQRPLQSLVNINGNNYLCGYHIYGENITVNGIQDVNNNLRGQLYRQFDASGLITHYQYDLAGNLLQSGRQFSTAYKSADPMLPVVNWSGTSADTSLVEKDEYVSLIQYDAVKRPIVEVRPFVAAVTGSIIQQPYTQAAINNADVLVQGYGESGLLNKTTVYERGGAVPTIYTTKICRNEKMQRLCLQYGNNTVTRYFYDTDTFRLVRQLTTANKGATVLQDLNYYYDPVGNVTYILDNAQPPVYYNNQKVLSDGNYTYDAIYQLINATGREQIGQTTVDENVTNHNYRNYPFNSAPIPAPGDTSAMRSYTEAYSYDAAGNMTQLKHTANGGSYTRRFAYNNNDADRAAFGVTATAIKNNQLIATTIGASPSEKYVYDQHGNMVSLPQLPKMSWNFNDEFVEAVQQSTGAGAIGQTTYYNYDSYGTRVRKVTEGAAVAGQMPAKISQRLYIAGFEVFREFDTLGNPILQRETLHLMDDTCRMAMIDNKTIDKNNQDATSLNTYYPRYQYGNHLDSAMVELDGSANIISYEEYHPFGTTSYQAANGALDVPEKRYRYTGKERDEESGLYYHGARYYAPWLARWTAADPIGVCDGLNIYVYVKSAPINHVDKCGHEGKNVTITIESEIVILDDAGKIKTATKDKKVVTPDGKTLRQFPSKKFNKEELKKAQVHIDDVKKQMAAEKQKEAEAVAKAAEASKTYTLEIAINPSSTDKKGNVESTGNPGHTIVILKDSDGKILKGFSYGPTAHSGISSIACSIAGTTGYGLDATDSFDTFDFKITSEQYQKATKKIKDIEDNPGTFSGTNQCTTTAEEVVDAAGVTIPRGLGTISIPLCGDAVNVATPVDLDNALKKEQPGYKTVNARTFESAIPMKPTK